MPKQSRQKRQTAEDILRDMFIAQLAVANLTQQQIREIVGVDMHRVNRIVKHFKKVKK
jgi:plasmid maintenance system antidote protein VapI